MYILDDKEGTIKFTETANNYSYTTENFEQVKLIIHLS
jgi:hypothetical protein